MKKLIIATLAAGALVLTGCGQAQAYPSDQNPNVTSQFNNDWFCDGDVYVPQGDDFECWDDRDGHSLFKKKKRSSYKRTTPYKSTITKPLFNKPIPANPAVPATPAKPATPAQPAKPAAPQQSVPKSNTSGSSTGSKSSSGSSSSGSKSSSSSSKSK